MSASIPIVLVTGFLGSGKTTLLRRLASTHGDLRLAWVVNEFSNVDVDGAMVKSIGERVVSIVGGSIFCVCKVTSFRQSLLDIQAMADEMAALGEPLDGVVVEASGMANPKVAAKMLVDAGLGDRFRLASVIAVVDPVTLPHLIHSLPAMTSQLEAADLAILNKSDLADENGLKAAEEIVRSANAAVPIVRAQHCELDIRLFAEDAHGVASASASHCVDAQYAQCKDPNFERRVIATPEGLVCDMLGAGINLDRHRLYRLKGVCRLDGSWARVEWASRRLELTALDEDDPADALAIHNARTPAAPHGALVAIAGQGDPDYFQQMADAIGGEIIGE